MHGHVILSHGSDSGPGATKVSALAELAEAMGWSATRPDYREDDKRGHAGSVAPRIARLRAHIATLKAPPVLVGSSMGAFVSGLASLQTPVAGLFLLATPGHIPGYADVFDLRDELPTLLIHGQHDEICPVDEIQAFADKRLLPLLVLEDDHRLGASMDAIAQHFRLFMDIVTNHPQATVQ
ncbi:alpha/beta family hydrolase [Dyella tabacisoli]|uniref:Alpha/beta hydrolase n=1 Tax=Dyella tabacisoli TaxID=2282381 RepID=A0A369UV35_9GAMM|nr:alpha/beta hydrolase [Dyella tabacisoli]RDD83598.1 alpha/beta hydrolase [Dyella tabacisoli]